MIESQNFPSIFGSSTWVDVVRYRAQIQPDDTAFIYLKDGVSDEILWTYKQLDQKSRAIAAWIQQNHLEGTRILLLYPPGLDFIAAFFGCLFAGATAVPVYPPKRNRSMIRIQAVADSAAASLALTTDDVLIRVEELINETPNLRKIPWLATTSLEEGLDEKWFPPEITPESLAFLQYTSGSTGTPKGVMLTHGNLIHNSMLISTGFEHTRSSQGVFWLPCYHDMGLIGGILQPVFVGRRNVLMSPLSFLTKPYRWLSAISKYRATTSGGPNFAFDLCVRQIKEELLDDLDLSSWNVAFNGAEPVQAETLEKFAAKFERCGFRYESFYPCFGLAEATLLVTGGIRSLEPVIKTVDADALAMGKAVDAIPGTDRIRRLVSSGRTIIDQRNAIVDPETKLECPPGTVGEIWSKSNSIAIGYWNAPEATEETFQAYIADSNEGPFMRTGDLGFMIDGELFVTGRIKDLIIIRGVNLYPQDIEATAQRVSPLLRPNCGGAFMVGEPRKEKLVLVQEVERRFHTEEAAKIFSEVRKGIAIEHEVSIDSIVLVRAGSIPKTSSGKIQRHACRNSYLDGSLNVVASWSLENEQGKTDKIDFAHKTAAHSESFDEEDNPLRYDIHADQLKNGSDDNELIDSTKRQRSKVRENEHHTELASVFTVDRQTKKTDSNADKAVPSTKIPQASVALSQLNYNETAKMVLEEVYRIGKERARNLTLDTDITELGLDSLERMEILASLEDRFGGQFPEQILPTLFTAREVVDAVRKYLGNGQKFDENRDIKKFKIEPECYDFTKFPEFTQLHAKIALAQELNLSHFFDVHEGITQATAVIGGKTYINFSSYNYIGSSGHPDVSKAAKEAIDLYGTSVSASRIVSGEKPIHRQLENGISEFLGTEDTIVLVSGHQTNESIVGHLMGSEDLILHDALAHNSLVQGAILSGARRRPFPHNDWEAVNWILSQHRNEYRRVLIVVEGTYSMDGDFPDLPNFIDIRNKYKTLLMIDEAHSIGVLGKTGRGIGEHFDVDRKDVDLWMSTLSKTFGSCGGYISGCKELIEYLKYSAPAFMFSVGMPPASAAAALASLQLLIREPQRCQQLRNNSLFMKQLAQEKGLNTGLATFTGVIPIIIGNSIRCLKISNYLFEHGINAQPILHPAVEEKAARIRFFLTSLHTKEQMRYTVETLVNAIQAIG
ncbi:MAG: aminotransferase class I/II-fold pyridoxal phosphate-dependent enzyme [Planctomycetia bacterium]|nr:aminotransferase class I/II-fold pyridoxal phosphate-dependent enzyme [Planctomycetia bacterium]